MSAYTTMVPGIDDPGLKKGLIEALGSAYDELVERNNLAGFRRTDNAGTAILTTSNEEAAKVVRRMLDGSKIEYTVVDTSSSSSGESTGEVRAA